MPLMHMQDLLSHAHGHGYALGAFEIVSLDFIEAIVHAAENRGAPVILSLSEAYLQHIDFELATAASVAAARRARVPVALQWHRAQSLDAAVRAINLGCNGVTIDASTPDLAANVAKTRALAEVAHGCGIPVAGMFGSMDAQTKSDEISPDKARDYVMHTGVDFLTVLLERNPTPLALKRLQDIRAAIGVPLTIDCHANLNDAQHRHLSAHGVAQINCAKPLADAAARCIHANANADYPSLLRSMRDAVRAEAERVMALLGAAGRAEAAGQNARAWREVEHCIVYNTHQNLGDNEVGQMMARGRDSLSAIPGVRRVFTGRTLRPDAPYRYCWLVRFANPAVVASYRAHPDHVAFADTQFRPQAADRISIDFESVE